MAKAAKSENIKVAVRVRPFISFIAAFNTVLGSKGSGIVEYSPQELFDIIAFYC